MPLFAALPAEVAARDTGVSKLFIAAIADLLSIQTDTAGVVSTAHTASAGQGFYEIPLIPGKEGKLTTDTPGEYPSQKNVVMGSFNAVGLSIEQVQHIQAMKGKTLLAIVQDGDCGSPKKWQVGCDCKPAIMTKAAFDTDTNILVLEFKAECSLKQYTAATITMAT